MIRHSRRINAPTFAYRNKQSRSPTFQKRVATSSDIIETEPLVCVRVGPNPWLLPQVDPALGPAGLVQPCPKPRALFHNPRLISTHSQTDGPLLVIAA